MGNPKDTPAYRYQRTVRRLELCRYISQFSMVAVWAAVSSLLWGYRWWASPLAGLGLLSAHYLLVLPLTDYLRARAARRAGTIRALSAKLILQHLLPKAGSLLQLVLMLLAILLGPYAVLLYVLLLAAWCHWLSPCWCLDPQPIEDGGVRQLLGCFARLHGADNVQIDVLRVGDRLQEATAAYQQSGRHHRIFFTDTMLEAMNEREILAAFAHELGHWRNGDILRAFFFHMSLHVLLMFTARVVIDAMSGGLATWPAALALAPLGLLTVYLLDLFFMPVLGWHSRRSEYAANQFALDATADPGAMVSYVAQLSRMNCIPIEHGSASLFSSHPSAMQVIEQARQYAREHNIPLDDTMSDRSAAGAPVTAG